MLETNTFSCADLSQIDPSLWQRGATLQLPLSGAARPWLCRKLNVPLLLIFPDSRQARDYIADASAMRLSANNFFLDELPFRESEQTSAIQAQRGETVSLWSHSKGVLVATPASLLSPLTSGDAELLLAVGENCGRDRLIQWLTDNAYERVELVWAPGQFAFRGSIVDFFSPSEACPVRVEFFDEEIESLRTFLVETQKSLSVVQRVRVKTIALRKSSELFSFFPSGMHVIYFSPTEIERAAENAEWLYRSLYSDKSEFVWQEWNQITVLLSHYRRLRITKAVAYSDLRLPLRAIPPFKGKKEALLAYCQQLTASDISITLVSQTASYVDWGVTQGFSILEDIVSEGFIDLAERVAYISDLELSGVTLARSTPQRVLPKDWSERLFAGQILIHENYGICSYLGVEHLIGENGENEYLVLQFAEGRKLMIPVMQSYLLSEYTTYPGQEITLDNLRGTSWKKASEKAKLQAEQAARFLIEIHAAREITEGYAYPGNDEEMAEFEKSFPYTETDDQLRAIKAVYADMERAMPMDRLIVGDVGFGKTEIALRAAAKAAFSGKQVLLMAPTTLLVQQHFETFCSRLNEYGIRVEMLSRFVSASRQKKIAADSSKGLVDILVGTHRLLGKDLSFKNLGLIIIDEEHRFGVAHKEYLKKAQPNVDVLMLSATPIPRSLYLSLAGLRDLSLLQTPPCKRLPVITVVGIWSEPLVKSAVLREISRGGQIYFIHNRIHSIDSRALMLRRLFPDLRIAVAHGRMAELELETCMRRFSEGEVDILLCTTIVESGLDIPKANTLIVDDAHELGLAQLYQLRGRVGRREEQAFALLLYPPEVQLTSEASERLEAIAELGDLGAGYRLSRRDLEIRGGGDLAGFNQHGHINRIGFQLYCTLLEQEIMRLRGDKKHRAAVEITVAAAIPETYLPQESLRIALYRKLLRVDEFSALVALKEEVRDRFGSLPDSLRFLFDIAWLRIWGSQHGVERILIEREQTLLKPITTPPLKKLPPGWFLSNGQLIGSGGALSLAAFIKHIENSRICYDECD